MKFYTILKLLLFIFLFSSCNTEEKERERKRNLETIQEGDEFDKFIAQYEPLYFDNTSLNYKFSYELEQVHLIRTSLILQRSMILLKSMMTNTYFMQLEKINTLKMQF